MNKADKVNLVSDLTKEFKDASVVVVCGYKGISVKKLEYLRNTARPSGIKIKIIKNKLASIVLENAGLPQSSFRDNNLFVWSNDQISLAKILFKFQNENPDIFQIKFGYIDNALVDYKHIEAVSKLPSRDELISMLLSVWMGPIRYFVTGIDNLRKTKGE